MKDLKKKYLAYTARLRERRVLVLSYDCPRCKQTIDTQVPRKANEVWHSIVMCPHCEERHFKIVQRDSIEAVLPELGA